MPAKRDLSRLLQRLEPRLHRDRYTFSVTADTSLQADQFALIRDNEGLTSVRPDPQGQWARISLDVHSSLEAVGLTAVLASHLAELGISVNMLAALNHDHLFVPWDRQEEAMACLLGLQTGDKRAL